MVDLTFDLWARLLEAGVRWRPGMLTLPAYVGADAAPDRDGVAPCKAAILAALCVITGVQP